MRKYTFVFMILDEQDNVVAERNLSPEQAIDLLVESEPIAGVPAPIVGRPKKTDFEKAMESTRVGRGTRKKGDPKECCGSTGSRHFKTCANYDAVIRSGVMPPSVPVQRINDIADFHQKKAEEKLDATKLSLEQYAGVRKAKEQAGEFFNASRYGLTNKISPLQAKRAARAENYEQYLLASD